MLASLRGFQLSTDQLPFVATLAFRNNLVLLNECSHKYKNRVVSDSTCDQSMPRLGWCLNLDFFLQSILCVKMFRYYNYIYADDTLSINGFTFQWMKLEIRWVSNTNTFPASDELAQTPFHTKTDGFDLASRLDKIFIKSIISAYNFEMVVNVNCCICHAFML